jgi:hypothetical protein
MRAEFVRMIGTVLGEIPWPMHDVSPADLRKHAALMLNGFYDHDEFESWPKREFFQKAPEEVRIVRDDGAIMIKYDLLDLIKDTGRRVVGNR